jgi:hypothetical protein
MGDASILISMLRRIEKKIDALAIKKLTYDYKEISVTHKTPVETLQTTPTSLLATKPTSPTKSITITSDSLPSCSEAPEIIQYQLFLCLGGKNESSTDQTLYYEIDVNGSLRASGQSSIPATNYWTISAFISDVKVEDVIDVYLWASSTLVNWDYDAYQVQVMNIVPKSKTLIWTCFFTATRYDLIQGSPSIFAETYPQLLDLDENPVVTGMDYGGTYNCFPLSIFLITENGGLSKDTVFVDSSPSLRPYYRSQHVVEKIKVVY